LDDDIGVADEFQYCGMVMGVFEVSGETFFVAIDGMKQRTITVQRQIANIELAAQIAPLGAFDFDDPRSQIGQTQGTRRPRQKLTHIEYD
jgi:hypothetical protein